MAQKTGNEETEFKIAETTLTLCINNCGFTGTPATKNMCQKCFNAGILTAHKFSGEKSLRSTSPTTSLRRSDFPAEFSSHVEIPDRTSKTVLEVSTTTMFKKKEVNRCSGCRRRVGLTGFRCRCGDLFCSEHRYSDRHECSYDYKSAGRDAIARENPVVKAAKIVRV